MSLLKLLQDQRKQEGTNPYSMTNNPYDMDMTAYGSNPTQNVVEQYKTPYTNEYFNPTNGNDYSFNEGQGFFDSLKPVDMIQGGVGIGQLALGLGNYFENKKLNKARISGLNQQIAESKYGVSRHKDFVSNTKQNFRA